MMTKELTDKINKLTEALADEQMEELNDFLERDAEVEAKKVAAEAVEALYDARVRLEKRFKIDSETEEGELDSRELDANMKIAFMKELKNEISI